MQTRKNWIGRAVRLAVCALPLLVCRVSAEGAQIASNFAGTNLGDWYSNSNDWSAVKFHTNGATWLATDIRVPVGVISTDDPQGGVFLRIYDDVAGDPGSPLGGKFKTTGTIFTSSIKTFTDESLGSTHLAANTDYWVVFAFEPGYLASSVHYSRTTLSPGAGPGSVQLGMRYSPNAGGSWGAAPAPGNTSALRMEINGVLVTVPEPSSGVLAAIGVIGLAVCGWRRKRSA